MVQSKFQGCIGVQSGRFDFQYHCHSWVSLFNFTLTTAALWQYFNQIFIESRHVQIFDQITDNRVSTKLHCSNFLSLPGFPDNFSKIPWPFQHSIMLLNIWDLSEKNSPRKEFTASRQSTTSPQLFLVLVQFWPFMMSTFHYSAGNNGKSASNAVSHKRGCCSKSKLVIFLHGRGCFENSQTFVILKTPENSFIASLVDTLELLSVLNLASNIRKIFNCSFLQDVYADYGTHRKHSRWKLIYFLSSLC